MKIATHNYREVATSLRVLPTQRKQQSPPKETPLDKWFQLLTNMRVSHETRDYTCEPRSRIARDQLARFRLLANCGADLTRRSRATNSNLARRIGRFLMWIVNWNIHQLGLGSQ